MSSERQHPDRTESRDESDRYTYEDATALDENKFNGETVDRRTFLSVAAATGAALALPGTVSAEVTDDALTDVAEYVVNSTPGDYEATLVLEFASVEDANAFYDEFGDPDWDIEEDSYPEKAVIREEPTPAGHAYLTADELEYALDDLGGVEFVDFSPGANPFWKLDGAYDDRVFPEVEDARDFVSHDELPEGLQYLEDEYPDRIRAKSIGQSPGHENMYTGEDADPKEIYIAAVTANAHDEEAFQEKDKAVFSLSIHGDEPAGRVGGTRLLEDAVKGEADALEGLLDDIVVVFLYVNPDGWVVRKPHYEVESWGGTQRFRYQRGNAQIGDTNRQYPTMGWVNPGYWPAEPEDTPEVRPDDPEGRGYEDMVPDALSVVEHFREYDNVEYLCDYHGMDTSDAMTLNLETNAPFDHDGTHNLDEVNRRIVDTLDDQWGGPEGIAEDTQRAGEDIHGISGYVPDRLIDYGSIYDCLGYQITGGLLGWAGQPEEFGGLGAVTVAPEMILRDGYDFKPYIERHLGLAYRLSMEQFSQMTAADTNSTIATGGQDTAYVASDVITRSSADLPFTDEGDDDPGQGPPPHATVRRGRGRAGRSGGVTVESGGSTHSLAAEFHAAGVEEGVVQLVNPGEQVVREVDLADPTTDDHSAFYVPDPDDGKWTVEYDGDADVDVETILLESEDEYPNPEETLGYSQREYEVNPMRFFEDLAPNLEDGEIDEISVHHVSVGRLLKGRSGKRHYDNVVISHTDGIDDDRYVSAIEDFVEAGGNLVLTDSGVNLLAELDAGDAAAISADDIEETTVDIANLNNRDFDHPLLTDIREPQQEVWKGSQLGYTTGDDSPVTTIDTGTFETAGGTVAGTMGGGWFSDGDVAAGTLSAGDAEINILGSVLPVANQRELHPFGMADYAVSFMGHTLLCNALGFEQRRYVDGELVGTWGEIR